MSKVWLVTGSASGLGRDIAEAVLASGDRLLATARDPGRLKDLVERYGKQVSTAPLDVTDEAAAKAAVAKAVEVFGRLDVVVNNAGYGDVAPFEQLSSERFRAVVDTNLFGVVYMTRAAIPVMRKQKSGYIFQISSVGGRLGVPGNAAYHAAKWAVGGFTEAIAPELAPFGVKICALEPGGIRTNWGKRAIAGAPQLLPDYEPSVGAFLKMLEGHWGMRRVIRRRSHRSFCNWPLKNSCLRIFCWAAMLCSMRALRSRSENPTPRHGMTSASQPMRRM